MKSIAIFPLAVLMFCSGFVQADEPSKEETKAFILKKAGKIKRVFGDEAGNRSRTYTLAFHEDSLTTTDTLWESDGTLLQSDTYTVQLSDLNPNRAEIKGGSGFVLLHVTDDEDRVETTKKSASGFLDGDYKQNTFYVWCEEDERTTKRLAKALSHLIELSGGTGDQFEEEAQ